jgi:hypothetical protein
MIDDFIKENEPIRETSAVVTKIEMDAVEKRIEDAWSEQAKRVEEELDVILDDFSNMIDEMKTQLQERVEAKRKTLRKRKEDFLTCLEEYTQKMALPKCETINDASALRAFIKIVGDSKSESARKGREILLGEKESIERLLEKANGIDSHLHEGVQRAREKMKDMRELLLPSNHHEKQDSLATRFHKCYETQIESTPFTFASPSRWNNVKFSNDMKTVKCIREDDYLMSDFDLTACSSVIKWRVKLEGVQRSGWMAVGVAHKSWISEPYQSHNTWVIRNDDKFCYDGDKKLEHGLNMKDAIVEISFEPKTGAVTFSCNGKQFAYSIPEQNRKELAPVFRIDSNSSITLL